MSRGLLLAVSLLSACGDPRTRPVEDEATVSPSALDFGPIFVGARADRSVELQLHSRASAGLRIEADPPFSVEATSLELAAGSTTTVSVRFTPAAVGEASSELRLNVAGKDLRVSLVGVGLPPLVCASSSPCVEAQFDPQAGRCVESPAREGEPCSNECLRNASCSAGSCVGSEVDCEDGDVCTVDACSPETGCLHLPRDCGDERDNPCRSGVCVPGEGCASVIAPEGTPCGEGRTCEVGECVWRPLTPETVCAMETPCQPAGVWSAGMCVRDAPVPLTSRWSWSGTISDGMVADEQGNLFWAENDYETWTAELISLDPQGTLRFRKPLGKPRSRPKGVREGLLFQLEVDQSGDYVAVRSTHTGELMWKRNFAAMLGLGAGAMHSSLVPAPGDELRLLAHADLNEPPMQLLSVGQEFGELRSSRRLEAEGQLQAVDEQGRSLLSLYSAGYQKAVHDRRGQLLWSDADSESRVDPFRFGVSLREDGRLERSEDGTLIAQLPTARAQLGYSELNPRFLVRGAAILLGRPLASGETWSSSKRQPATHVYLQPFPSGALQMHPVSDGRPFLALSEVHLTSRGGLLYVEVNLAGGLRLREVRVTGEVLYECPLVAPARLTCCLTPTLGKTQLLLDERWIIAPTDGGVYSFDLKGVFPAASP